MQVHPQMGFKGRVVITGMHSLQLYLSSWKVWYLSTVSLQLKPRSPRCNNVIKKDCWESFCFLTTQRFTDTKPWLMLGFARKECSWDSRNFKLQLFHEYVFDSGGSEIVLEDPFLNMKRKALKYVSCLLCPPHRRILMTYPREVLVLWPIQIFYERHRQNLWRKFSKNERCTNFA